MSVQVITVANRIPDRAREPYYRPDVFLASMDRWGEKPIIVGMGEWWGGLMTKPRRLREWLRGGHAYADTLIVCDMFDIVFTTRAQVVADAYLKTWTDGEIVMNAEKGLFPRGELAHKFPDVGTPWRYLNSGFMIGPPARILSMLESMWLDDIADDFRASDTLHGGPGTHVNPNDQGHYQYAYAAQVVPIKLDHRCKLCQSLSACTVEEFDLTGESIKNVVTGETPLVHHFNGGSKNDLMPIFLAKWGLE